MNEQRRNKKLKDLPYKEFVWFVGVVEDIKDPEKINRVRVRCIGFHTENRANLPVEDLPWAPFLSSTGAISGPMVVQGDWVVGFFMDGHLAQQPVVMGTITGKPSQRPPTKKGFSDPDGIHPKNLNEGTNSRLARNESPETIEYTKKTVTEDVPVAGGGQWSEPPSQYAAEYPYNHVIQGDGYSLIELDNTPDKERVQIFHRSGSFIEFHPDGKTVYRNIDDKYEVTFGNQNMFVNGTVNITAAGDVNLAAGKNMNLSCSGDLNIQAGGRMSVVAGADITQFSSGRVFVEGTQVRLNDGISKPSGEPAKVSTKKIEKFEGK